MSAEVDEARAPMLVGGVLVVVRGVVGRFGVQHVLDDVRQLLCELHGREHGDEQQDRQRAHVPTVTDGAGTVNA